MKISLLIALISLLTISCTTYRPPLYRSSGFVDYRDYTDDGFFITESNSVSFEYKPIGSVYASVASGYEVDKTKPIKQFESGYRITPTTDKYITLTTKDALADLVAQAKKLGANGLINVSIKNSTTYNGSGSSMITASGMAINK